MAKKPRGMAFRILRALIVAILMLFLLPYVLALLYRVADPVSALMLWRRATGHRLERTWVPLTAIAPTLPRAVMAAEDARFCIHHGIDFGELRAAFEDADVLQENIILAGIRKGVSSVAPPLVTISQSRGLSDLAHPLIQQTPRRLIIDEKQKDPILHLPTSDIDTHLLQAFRRWDNRLATYGLEISTGPVVPFRTADLLTTVEQVKQGEAIPLLWLQHVRRMEVKWPLEHFDKPQGVFYQTDQKLFVNNSTKIVLRRFSAKEEPRRITAAVLPAGAFGTELIALENHLNYLYRSDGVLTNEEAQGIVAFLNSTFVDRYFRITNGNTQVNATELRKLPLPRHEQLTRIGERVVELHNKQDFDAIEHIIMEELGPETCPAHLGN